MLLTRLSEITDSQILELLGEIDQVKRMGLGGHQETRLFHFLQLTQIHSVTGKPQNIEAEGCHNWSILKTPIKKLRGTSVETLAVQLCAHFNVSAEFIDDKRYYVFLNQILNPKSKLRKPPPFRF